MIVVTAIMKDWCKVLTTDEKYIDLVFKVYARIVH